MTSTMILRECTRRGIVLATDGDSIRIKSPPGVMTDSLRAAIRDHKPAIVAALDGNPSDEATATGDHAPCEDTFSSNEDAVKTRFSESVFTPNNGIHPEKKGFSEPDIRESECVKTKKTQKNNRGDSHTTPLFLSGDHPCGDTTATEKNASGSITNSPYPSNRVFFVFTDSEVVESKEKSPKTQGENRVFGSVFIGPESVFTGGETTIVYDSGPSEPDPWAAIAIHSPPRPMPWRAILPNWPVDVRERWGKLANRLQDEGLDWFEAERQAFEEVNGGPIRGDQARTARENAAREAKRDREIDAMWAGPGFADFSPEAIRNAGIKERPEVKRPASAGNVDAGAVDDGGISDPDEAAMFGEADR